MTKQKKTKKTSTAITAGITTRIVTYGMNTSFLSSFATYKSV